MSLTFTDPFCGAGGSSLGLTTAGLELKLAANHWQRAIETHAVNFREAQHWCTDIDQVDMRCLPRTDVLWASPICTEASPGPRLPGRAAGDDRCDATAVTGSLAWTPRSLDTSRRRGGLPGQLRQHVADVRLHVLVQLGLDQLCEGSQRVNVHLDRNLTDPAWIGYLLGHTLTPSIDLAARAGTVARLASMLSRVAVRHPRGRTPSASSWNLFEQLSRRLAGILGGRRRQSRAERLPLLQPPAPADPHPAYVEGSDHRRRCKSNM
jgi:hypothetical protein